MNVLEDSAFRTAVTAIQAGRLKDAEPLLRAVLGMRPTHVGALNLLGVVLMQLGQLTEAEAYLRRALDQQGPTDATLYNYGLVLKALGRPAEALERFTKRSASIPASPKHGTAAARRSTISVAIRRPLTISTEPLRSIRAMPMRFTTRANR